MTIDTKGIEESIEYAERMREHHYQQGKIWKQEIYRLRTDLERAQRINQNNGQ